MDDQTKRQDNVTAFPETNPDVRKGLMLRTLDKPDPLEPQTIGEAMEIARILAGSDLLPESCRNKPANALVVTLFGRTLGLNALQSLMNVSLIGTRLTVWGEAPLGIVQARAGDLLESFEEGWNSETETAWCEVTRRGRKPVRREFSMAEARKIRVAHRGGPDTMLVEKDTWRNYPRRMCKFKARNECLNDSFPELLMGILTQEEAQEFIEVQPVAVDGQPTSGWEGLLSEVDTEQAERIAKGFDHLEFSPATRVVWIKRHTTAGVIDAGRLYEKLQEEVTLRLSGGQQRKPTARRGTSKAEPDAKAIVVDVPERQVEENPQDVVADAQTAEAPHISAPPVTKQRKSALDEF